MRNIFDTTMKSKLLTPLILCNFSSSSFPIKIFMRSKFFFLLLLFFMPKTAPLLAAFTSNDHRLHIFIHSYFSFLVLSLWCFFFADVRRFRALGAFLINKMFFFLERELYWFCKQLFSNQNVYNNKSSRARVY